MRYWSNFSRYSAVVFPAESRPNITTWRGALREGRASRSDIPFPDPPFPILPPITSVTQRKGRIWSQGEDRGVRVQAWSPLAALDVVKFKYLGSGNSNMR